MAEDDGSVVGRYIRRYEESLAESKWSQSSMVFRGQSNSKWDLLSGADRRLQMTMGLEKNMEGGEEGWKKVKANVYLPIILGYHEDDLLEHARGAGYGWGGDAAREPHDLERLAQMQHYGAATLLTDFSKDFLFALWVAAGGGFSTREEEQENGVVFCVHLNADDLHEVGVQDLKSDETLKGFMNGRTESYFYWEPLHRERRPMKQSGVFVFGRKPIEDLLGVASKERGFKLVVKQEDKEPLLRELRDRHNIHAVAMFPDAEGFSRASSALSPLAAPRALFLEALALEGQGIYREAIKKYTEAIARKPDYVAAYNNRGNAKFALGRLEKDDDHWGEARAFFEKALEDYDGAIRLKPDYAAAYNNIGNVKLVLGRFEEALENYGKAIKIKPDYAEAYNNRGIVKENIGLLGKDDDHWGEARAFFEEALKDFDKAIGIKSDYADAYNNRGHVKLALGRHEEALGDYNQAKELWNKLPPSADTKQNLERVEPLIAMIEEELRRRGKDEN